MDARINPEFHSLFQDFYTVTGIRTGICDLNYQPLTNVRADDLCHFFHAERPETYQTCVDCDHWAIQKCLETKSGFLFRCPLGLLEYGTPLFSNDSIIGYASTGMITDGSNEERNKLKEVCDRLSLDFDQAMSYYDQQIHRSVEEIRSVCTIFETCVSHIYFRNSLRLQEMGKINRIETYIIDHLSDNINVVSLCKSFDLSKAELYQLVHNRANCGVAEFIKAIRLKTAENLLRSSNYPITDIADRVGFPNYSYFTKVFKREYGLTPRDYRKKQLAQVRIDTSRMFDTLSLTNDSLPFYHCFD